MRKLMIALAMAAAFFLPLNGHTLGLGEIQVNSALNQELDAEIELLSAVAEDAEALIVKLASREEFNRAGLDRPFLLQGLKFSNAIKNGVPYVKITSSKPIREPFLNFLIELDWPKGHLLREYTILLDPPIYINEESAARPAVRDGRPAAMTPAPAPAGTSSSRPGAGAALAPPVRNTASTAAAPAQATQTRALPAPVYAAARQSADYRIKQGDTAWSLADALRPDQSVSIEQMMLALLRSNPESFINDNVNGLKRGYILRVPDRNEITSVSQADAVAMVRQQNALWREYQQVAGSGGAASAMTKSGAAKGAAKPAKAASARLSIVSAGKGAAAGSAGNVDTMSAAELRSQLALLEEKLESELLEKENLQGEVGALEQQVDKMKRLLSIEDVSLAQMQATATAAKPVEPAMKSLAKAKAEAGIDKPADSVLPLPAETESTEPDSAMLAEPAESESDTVFLDQQEKSADTSESLDMASEPAVAADAMGLDEEIPATQPKGLLVSLFGSPELLAAAGAGVLLLMALVYMLVKRRRNHQSEAVASSDFMDDDLADVADMLDDDAVNEMVSDEEVAASMRATDTADDDFDSDATMILPAADETMVSQSEHVEEEARDDIIAEADVYLAYGIYQQAEELLQGAISEHPENDAYRMKLAETYFAGKNVSGFGELAAEMHKRTKGEGKRWQKLAAMGKELIPGHELFKGASAVAAVELDDLVPSPEPMDFDLGLDDSSTSATSDLDFSLEDDLELPDDAQADTAILNLEDDSPTAAMEELEFDLSETEAAKADDADDEFSLDFAAADLDIASETSKTETEDSLDYDLDLSAEADDEDADDIDFDIDVSEELEASATVVTSTSALHDDGAIDLSDLDDVDEVSTKLDLARAYLDMGDNEGTRSILEEVVAEGNAEQKAEAETLLAEIAG